jgi:hypothetical protein
MILATHGIIGSLIVQFTGLLDTYSGAAAAYSLRKLRTAYTGSAIRVRRAVGSPSETDIGFVDNELDVATLESFCSGTNGFVTVWYDQSGNTINATQTSLANQPQIVNSGSLILQGNKPTLQFDGINDTFNGSLLTSGAYSAYAILKSNTQTGFRGIFTASQMMMLGSTTSNWGTFGSASHPANTDIRNIYSLVSMISPSGTGTFYHNGLADGTYLNSSSQYISGGYIGGIQGQIISANIQEIIFWQIDQSSNRNGIEDNINDFYSIY